MNKSSHFSSLLYFSVSSDQRAHCLTHHNKVQRILFWYVLNETRGLMCLNCFPQILIAFKGDLSQGSSSINIVKKIFASLFPPGPNIYTYFKILMSDLIGCYRTTEDNNELVHYWMIMHFCTYCFYKIRWSSLCLVDVWYLCFWQEFSKHFEISYSLKHFPVNVKSESQKHKSTSLKENNVPSLIVFELGK